jgi:hypothetical protein
MIFQNNEETQDGRSVTPASLRCFVPINRDSSMTIWKNVIIKAGKRRYLKTI